MYGLGGAGEVRQAWLGLARQGRVSQARWARSGALRIGDVWSGVAGKARQGAKLRGRIGRGLAGIETQLKRSTMEKQEGLKEQIKKAEIDRRELADAIGITPAYLTQMLNGWAPMKDSYEKAIRVELEKR